MGSNNENKQGFAESWHMSQKVMIGVITALAISGISQVFSYVYLAKILNTTPPLPERVLLLEYKISDFAKTLESSNRLINETNQMIREIKIEQSRRKPMIDYTEKRMNREQGK